MNMGVVSLDKDSADLSMHIWILGPTFMDLGPAAKGIRVEH